MPQATGTGAVHVQSVRAALARLFDRFIIRRYPNGVLSAGVNGVWVGDEDEFVLEPVLSRYSLAGYQNNGRLILNRVPVHARPDDKYAVGFATYSSAARRAGPTLACSLAQP